MGVLGGLIDMDAINMVYGIYQNGQSVGFLSHDSFAEFFKDVCIDLVCPIEEREYITDKVDTTVNYFEFGKFFSDEDGTTLYKVVGKFPKRDMVELGKEFYFNKDK